MKTSTKLLALLLTLVMVLSLFAGCAKHGSNETQSTQGNTTEGNDPTEESGSTEGNDPSSAVTGNYGGHMNMRIAADPTGLDPLNQTGVWKYLYTSCVFESILTRDANNVIRPSVCDFTLSDDYLTLELWVRDGASFSNGNPVTIDDVEASINRSLNLYKSCKNYVAPYIKSMVKDGDTLTITFTEYREKIMYYLASFQPWVPVMPKEICEKYAEDYIGDHLEDAIGTGPYVYTDFDLDISVTVSKRADYVPVPAGYTGPAAPKMGYLDSITFWYGSNGTTATLALFSGQYDMIEFMPVDSVAQAEAIGIINEVLPTNTGCAIVFNTKGTNNVCATNKDLRKAIMAAIDFEEFLYVVTDDMMTMGGCPVLNDNYYTDVFETVDYYGPDNQEVVDRYMAAARENGYDETPVQLVVSASRPDIATMLSGYLTAANIPYETTTMEATACDEFRGNPDNNWDFYFLWPTYTQSPGSIPANLLSTNYKSDEKDEIVKQLETAVIDSAEYHALWEQLAQIMVEDCASVHMSNFNWYWYHLPTLHSNDEGISRYVYNTYWDDPENHPAP